MCSGIIAAIFYFYWIFKYHKDENFFKNFKKITYLFVLIYFIAILLVGSNSYVKNLVDHHNPLYPLIGKDKVDIVTKMQPKDFGELNGIEKFTYALFSKTENTTYEMLKPKFKYPFKIYNSEIEEINLPDVRIGGFGPLFTLSLIISIILFIPSLIILIIKDKDKLKYVIITILSIIISMIMTGEAWWARYVPYFYFVTIGTLLLTIYISRYINKKYLNYAKYILIIPLIINIYLFIDTNNQQLKSFKIINNDLNEMKCAKNLTISTEKESYGYQYVLKDKGINYKFVKELDSNDVIYKYQWRIQVKK